jgi:hypothetical protein
VPGWASSRATNQELGLRFEATYSAYTANFLETAAGDAGVATEDLLAAGQTFEAMSETYVLASV